MSKHKVLIPVDGSEFSSQVFDCIREYLPAEENELTLIRVAKAPSGHVGRPSKPAAPDSKVPMFESRGDVIETQHPIYASQERDSKASDLEHELHADVQELENEGYKVNTVIRFNGHPGKAILNYINSTDVDMVAMTTRGRSGIERLLRRSTAEYLSHNLTLPIMMMRPRTQNKKRNNR
jgi:nucleotide-binding universal stress UspA family protein